jgi:GrpB-like predicted nucleotidyltransferase (UPF0157 family)
MKFEHVGSTAVVGSRVKPVVDIIARVRSLDDVPRHVPALRELGYVQITFLVGRLFFLNRWPTTTTST